MTVAALCKHFHCFQFPVHLLINHPGCMQIFPFGCTLLHYVGYNYTDPNFKDQKLFLGKHRSFSGQSISWYLTSTLDWWSFLCSGPFTLRWRGSRLRILSLQHGWLYSCLQAGTTFRDTLALSLALCEWLILSFSMPSEAACSPRMELHWFSTVSRTVLTILQAWRPPHASSRYAVCIAIRISTLTLYGQYATMPNNSIFIAIFIVLCKREWNPYPTISSWYDFAVQYTSIRCSLAWTREADSESRFQQFKSSTS